ncbi:Clavaminate synthase-like protein [Clavulina sp. PMI_390]|nr:Clavaminate synthase-like protein [Clavulina sp. PMI_390]
MPQSVPIRIWASQTVRELAGQYSPSKDPSITVLNKCADGTVATLLDVTTALLALIIIDRSPAGGDRVIAPLRSGGGSKSSSPKLKAEESELIPPPTMSLATVIEKLNSFRTLARSVFQSVHHSKVETSWRRLFTDASLLLVLASLQQYENATKDDYKRYVGILDEAIVIAGAPGPGRSDMCHDAIARIQDEFLPIDPVNVPSSSRLAAGNPSEGYPEVFEDNSVPIDNRQSKRPKRATRNTTATLNGAVSTAPAPPLPETSGRLVERMNEPPSFADYKAKWYDIPFIIRGYASDWPACSSWGNPQYLRMVGGLGRVVPVETARAGEDYTSEGWSTSLMDWEEFLDHLYQRSVANAKAKAAAANLPYTTSTTPISRPATPVESNVPRKRGRPPATRANNTATPQQLTIPISGLASTLADRAIAPLAELAGESHYLAQHDLIGQFPELRSDIIIPDYVYSEPPKTRAFPHHKPPRVEGLCALNTWIGPKGCITPPHKDPYFNCYVQVVGRKTVWLAHPAFNDEMYPYEVPVERPSEKPASTSTQASDLTRTNNSTPSPTHSSTSDIPPSKPNVRLPAQGEESKDSVANLNNTSRVPVFGIITADDHARFPRFFHKVAKNAVSAVLEPGDLLIIPPGWWHAMRSEETSSNVSIWY